MSLDLKNIINDCLEYELETERFEFKENRYNADEIGEYISALSNSSTILNKPYGFLIWGINDKTHEIVGTKFDFYKEINNEPLEHYLARNLTPSIEFYFREIIFKKKRLVVLVISAAKTVPTDYKNERFIRIGSSKENLKKYKEREAYLFSILNFGSQTIVSKESEYQDLKFNQLKTYLSTRDISFKEKTFFKNLNLITKDSKFNIMAQLLSDDSHISIRVAIFNGETKASKLYSVKEFGYKCLLISLNEVLDFGETLNTPQADEKDRIMERKEIMLFDFAVFREAVINAFLHNKWIDLNEPMITFYSNRVEILSRGTLPPLQTIHGFYEGHSIPVNEKLSEIFLRLHISEKTGRGIPTIISKYGKECISLNVDNILISIPFTRIGEEKKCIEKEKLVFLNASQNKILEEIRSNPNITKPQLCSVCKLSKTSVDKCIQKLRKLNLIKRVGANKNGYWEVAKKEN